MDPVPNYWKIRATTAVARIPVRLSIEDVPYAFVFAVLAAVAAANFGVAWWLGLRRVSGLLLSSVLGGGIPGAWLFSASSALGPEAAESAQGVIIGASSGAAVGLMVGTAILWYVRRSPR